MALAFQRVRSQDPLLRQPQLPRRAPAKEGHHAKWDPRSHERRDQIGGERDGRVGCAPLDHERGVQIDDEHLPASDVEEQVLHVDGQHEQGGAQHDQGQCFPLAHRQEPVRMAHVQIAVERDEHLDPGA